MLDYYNQTEIGRKTKMPFGRKKRLHSSSFGVTQVEAEGLSWLCFPPSRDWFQGSIVSKDDESNYSLYGRRDAADAVGRRRRFDTEDDESLSKDLLEKLGHVFLDGRKASTGESSEDDSYGDSLEKSSSTENFSSNSDTKEDLTIFSGDEEESKVEYYNVILTDHFSGLSYQLPKLGIKFTCQGEALFISSSEAQVAFKVERFFKGQKADMMIQKKIGAPSLLGQKCKVYSGPMSIAFEHALESSQSWSL